MNSNFECEMTAIIEAMKSKGHEPFAQLEGYIVLGDPLYITAKDNARGRIQKLDKEEVKRYWLEHKDSR